MMYNNSISAEMFLQTYVNTYIVSIAQKSTFINVLIGKILTKTLFTTYRVFVRPKNVKNNCS
jgi:hypothetical protein